MRTQIQHSLGLALAKKKPALSSADEASLSTDGQKPIAQSLANTTNGVRVGRLSGSAYSNREELHLFSLDADTRTDAFAP
jgi:hypothetical protein